MGRSRLKNSKLDKTVLQKTPSPERPPKPATSPESPPDLPTTALDRICIGFIFLLSMFIYLSTVYPSLPGGDSGELMVSVNIVYCKCEYCMFKGSMGFAFGCRNRDIHRYSSRLNVSCLKVPKFKFTALQLYDMYNYIRDVHVYVSL